MSDPLTDAANAFAVAAAGVSSSSPKIKDALIKGGAFASLATKRIEADEAKLVALTARVDQLTPTPTPTPAPSTRIGNGLLGNQQGNSFGTFTPEQEKAFGTIISGSDKSAAFGKLTATYPTIHGLIYHTIFEVGVGQTSAVWPNAITAAEALAKGFVYRDQAGNPVKDSGGVNYICDPGNPAYLAEWVATVKAQVALGAAGVFVDNCIPDAWWGTRPWRNGAAVTDAEIANGLMAFFAYAKAAGLYLVANIGTWTADRVAFIPRAADVVGGVMIENYTAATVQQLAIEEIQAAGRDPFVITPGGVVGSSPAAHQYATAFASVWDRKGGGFGVDAAEPADPNWTVPISG